MRLEVFKGTQSRFCEVVERGCEEMNGGCGEVVKGVEEEVVRCCMWLWKVKESRVRFYGVVRDE